LLRRDPGRARRRAEPPAGPGHARPPARRARAGGGGGLLARAVRPGVGTARARARGPGARDRDAAARDGGRVRGAPRGDGLRHRPFRHGRGAVPDRAAGRGAAHRGGGGRPRRGCPPGVTPGPRLPGGRPTWRNPGARPGAFVVRRARAATTPEEAHAVVTDPAFRPGEEAVVEAPLPALAPPAGEERAALVADAPERVAVAAEVSAPALLVLTDSFFPGWEAELDGTRVPVLRADYAFRAVALEGAERRLIVRAVKPGMVAVDVGANLGVHTLALARAVGPAGRVHALEPDPANFRLLARAVAEAGAAQVTLHRAAAAAQAGEIDLHLSPVNRGDHRLHPEAARRARLRVPVIVLDELLAGEPHVDFVKIDVQGAEVAVL